jgi:hypothetical protein
MEFFRLIRSLPSQSPDKAESWAIRFRGRCDFVRAKITEHLVSSPDEFPKQRSREDGFSGLIFDLGS